MAEKKPIHQLNFEEALAQLQDIVTAMEKDENALREALDLFERGQALAQRCADLLEQADLKVRELSSSGELKDFAE